MNPITVSFLVFLIMLILLILRLKDSRKKERKLNNYLIKNNLMYLK